MREKAAVNAPIDEGHKSTLLAHLGSMAWRTGRVLKCDPATGRVINDAGAMKLWEREYAPGWTPKV